MDLSLSDNQRLALPHKARGKPQRKHGDIRKQRAECEGLPTHYLACRESPSNCLNGYVVCLPELYKTASKQPLKRMQDQTMLLPANRNQTNEAAR